MPDSISPRLDGYVLDTNVLSLLAKAGQLVLLEHATVPLYVTPTIKLEIETGVRHGVAYLADAMQLIDGGAIHVISDVDTFFTQQLPAKLGQGEAEAIAVCHQSNLILITHDRKAINYCERQGIGCIPLLDLLKEFVSVGLLGYAEMELIVS